MVVEKNSLSRRDFLKKAGAAGAVLSLGFYFPSKAGDTSIISAAHANDLGIELNGYIFIEKSGLVTIANPRPEIGQGVYQAIPMLVAEELDVDIDKIKIVQFGRDEKRFGRLQNIGGSGSIRGSWTPLRKLGAAARHVLVKAAAQQWNVDDSECKAENGEVIHIASGRRLNYGLLCEAASKLEPPKDPALKEPSEFKILGKPVIRQDAKLKTNGEAKFGIDLVVPGMVHASVEYGPTITSTVKSFDASAALAIRGVKKIFKTSMRVYRYQREGIAVIADSFWTVQSARKLLRIEWGDHEHQTFSEGTIMEEFRKSSSEDGKTIFKAGDMQSFADPLIKIVEKVYEAPYQAHATMEPMNCIVSVADGKCEYWGGTQSPGPFHRLLADQLKIPKENVTVHVPFIGGGFGRRGHEDFVQQAALLASEVGSPVKLVWTREDDMKLSLFRPATVNVMRATIDKDLNVTGIQNKLVIQDLDLQETDSDRSAIADWIFDGAEQPYEIPNINRSVVAKFMAVPVGYWRSVYASTNTFAMECFMDELAELAKSNPLDLRNKLLSASPRYLNVLRLANEKSDFLNKWKKNEGVGIALGNAFGSICCHVAQIGRRAGKLRLNKVTTVFDCGLTVNPDTIRAQVEGSIIMGLGAAVFHSVHFKDGVMVEKNFDSYQMPRITDIPEIEIHIVDNHEEPGGVGEPALPPLAPALANAISNLTGKRVTRLPIDLSKF